MPFKTDAHVALSNTPALSPKRRGSFGGQSLFTLHYYYHTTNRTHTNKPDIDSGINIVRQSIETCPGYLRWVIKLITTHDFLHCRVTTIKLWRGTILDTTESYPTNTQGTCQHKEYTLHNDW